MLKDKDNRPYVPWDVMDSFMTQAFMKYGLPEEDAKLCTDVLLESDRRGIESHGCNRFKPIYLDRIKNGILNPITKIDVIKETCTTAVLDANDGMGMVAVRNSSHFGIAGYWAGMAEKEGMIGICGTNARPSIAPTFGVENMLGTNPLTFAMPSDEEFPFVLDCATSVIQNGKIEYYARIDHDTPEGLVISREGEILTDSKQIIKDIRSEKAALAPLGGFGEDMGGYKGYGYATVVEILSAALQAGIFLKALEGKNEDGSIRPYHLGHFFMAIDTEAFMGLESFKKTTGDILRELRNSKKDPKHSRIYTAGEKEWDVWQERKDKGVPLTKAVQDEFIQIRNECQLDIKFPFE